ncbi:class I SAM-dependent methyltransferase [Robiginitalea biformata]|uniref:SAM-dependent methyltransferase n=1 Tax=Robiginitalea biformata (strain ATCC BAA-864 / DSM 15991 / KCTC 12146 / HTCC2501) TaxID=313596 RepID=A4CJE5_ROBBH|nr:class I SAM-dependent methyltransferase [Robiginitalea biformata]EAR17053.1 SAM-dependent methyltransferase [Robiginitalea biformata HTCC2501]
MSDLKNSAIEAHYYRERLSEDILKRLGELGVDLKHVRRSDIAAVDEFHVRGAEVSRELAERAGLHGAKLLDVGCGLGGPCRMLADEFDCQVVGVDLSGEFIRTARKLSDLVGLSEKTEFLQCDATSLPFADASFDAVWTQHVQMNIERKDAFYGEISRVLKPGGKFIYYDIFKLGPEPITYPVPWADNPDISFLQPASHMSEILLELGMKSQEKTDQTKKGIEFFERVLQKIAASGPPKLGLNVLMGSETKVKITNLVNGLKEKKIQLQSGCFIR